MLISHVRNTQGQKIGVLVALNKDQIGWSRVSKKDQFNRHLGRTIATGRARYGCQKEIPSDIAVALPHFQERIVKYFK